MHRMKSFTGNSAKVSRFEAEGFNIDTIQLNSELEALNLFTSITIIN